MNEIEEVRRRLRGHIEAQKGAPNHSEYGDGMIAGLELTLRVMDDVAASASRRRTEAMNYDKDKVDDFTSL